MMSKDGQGRKLVFHYEGNNKIEIHFNLKLKYLNTTN